MVYRFFPLFRCNSVSTKISNDSVKISKVVCGNWTIKVPSSKSMTNRAIHLASLAQGVSYIKNPLEAQDTQHMVKAWQAFGAEIEWEQYGLKINGCAGNIAENSADIFVGNAGTVARFVIASLLKGTGGYRLYGEQRMHERPMKDLLGALSFLGLSYRSEEDKGHLPLTIKAPRDFKGDDLVLGCDKSSQFLSALLMIAPYCNDVTSIRAVGKVVSRPYIEMTIAMMHSFGVKVAHSKDDHFLIAGRQVYNARTYHIEADASSASYFFTLAAISCSRIKILGIHKTSLQGDLAYLDILEQMGCKVVWYEDGVCVEGTNSLQAIDVDMNEMTDVVPSLVIAALFAKGTSFIHNIAHMRYKECDRIAVLSCELTKLGAKVKTTRDCFIVQGREPLHSAVCETYEDHRIAMALSILGTQVQGVEILNPQCVCKTFPSFYEQLSRCYE